MKEKTFLQGWVTGTFYIDGIDQAHKLAAEALKRSARSRVKAQRWLARQKVDARIIAAAQAWIPLFSYTAA